jgi:hypothetical protein
MLDPAHDGRFAKSRDQIAHRIDGRHVSAARLIPAAQEGGVVGRSGAAFRSRAAR